MKSKICEQCIHCDECWILDPMECGEYKPLDEYMQDMHDAFCEEFYRYVNSFEND